MCNVSEIFSWHGMQIYTVLVLGIMLPAMTEMGSLSSKSLWATLWQSSDCHVSPGQMFTHHWSEDPTFRCGTVVSCWYDASRHLALGTLHAASYCSETGTLLQCCSVTYHSIHCQRSLILCNKYKHLNNKHVNSYNGTFSTNKVEFFLRFWGVNLEISHPKLFSHCKI